MNLAPTPLQGRFTSGPWALRREILALAIPVLMEQLLTTLTHIVDTVMVGRLGPEAVAAVGISHHPLMFSLALFMGIGTGTTALIAKYTGASEPDTVESVTRNSFWMGLAAAVVVALAYFALAPAILSFMGADETVAPLGVAFLRWSVPGFVAMQWASVMSGALRGRGDTVTPFYIGIVVNLVNVILGYSLIYGHLGLPALGVVGSALGTSIARIAGAAILLVVLFRSHHPVRLRLSTLFQIDFTPMLRVLKIGLPASMERVVQSLGMITFTRIIAGLGTASMAAHQITMSAESLSYMPAMGLATAGTALVGRRVGAKDEAGAGEVVRETVRISIVIMSFTMLLFFFLSRPFIGLYTTDLEVLELGARMLKIAAAVQIPMGITFALAGALRGVGDTVPMMIVTGLGVWGVRLSITLGLIRFGGWGLAAAWASMFFDWSFRALFAWWRFRSGAWRRLRF